MPRYVALLRGINVGGKNTISMAGLRQCLEDLGFSSVTTYINSGNVVLVSTQRPAAIQAQIEEVLPKTFTLDSTLIKVLVLTRDQLQAVVDQKPKGFGMQPAKYHSDVIFLMGISTKDALSVFSPREGVDAIWPGNGVIYSQRLSAKRTKSRLNVIMLSPLYQSMTIRNWTTTTKLLTLLTKMESENRQ
ncbi:DUF1697 domain-containing protein [Candidatus Berkelbacteria bacterium]|nr:DUF1697 domain-containing protein [Candidatus Berkelbacteria bacterium]